MFTKVDFLQGKNADIFQDFLLGKSNTFFIMLFMYVPFGKRRTNNDVGNLI